MSSVVASFSAMHFSRSKLCVVEETPDGFLKWLDSPMAVVARDISPRKDPRNHFKFGHRERGLDKTALSDWPNVSST